jgi:hypothetical protein
VVAALLHPEATKNRALRVNSFTTTPLEIVFISYEEARASEKKAYEDGNPAAVGFTLRRIWGEGGTLYERSDNWIIGAEEGLDTLSDAVKVAVATQQEG